MNIKDLDFKTAGFWPEKTKMLAYAFAFGLVAVLGWLLVLSGKYSDLNLAKEKEITLKAEFDTVQTKANNLGALKEELNQINDLLKTLAAQLPNQNEIPELVVNVSQAALANGLQVDLFEPQEETKKEFYAEKRINVILKGDYHRLGSFFSEVAQQPRLISVVVDNMKMTVVPTAATPRSEERPTNIQLEEKIDPTLNFEGKVRTYRYLSDEEEAEIAKLKKEEEAKNRKKRAPPKQEEASTT